MKIAQIAPPWIAIPPTNYGGTENVIYNLVEEQVSQGHDVTLFAPADAKTSAKLISFLPCSLIEDNVPWESHLQAYYHLHKSLEFAREFDIVHTHLSSCTDMYVLPLVSSLKTPHVCTLHSLFPFDRLPNGWTSRGDQYFLEEWGSSVPMVAISENARAIAPQSLNFIGVVHNGLLIKQFQPAIKSRGSYFVWLGKFVPEKGAHIAIEASKRADVVVVLAGLVDKHSQRSVHYFDNYIKPFIDNEQVKYIGPVNMKQKINLLNEACGFLNPINLEESFGMVMIEAMALGCPVISFARGAALELIVHGKTGFLVQDIDEMVNFIHKIDDIDRDVTYRHVVDNFSATSMVEKYIKIYKRVIMMKKELAHD